MATSSSPIGKARNTPAPANAQPAMRNGRRQR